MTTIPSVIPHRARDGRSGTRMRRQVTLIFVATAFSPSITARSRSGLGVPRRWIVLRVLVSSGFESSRSRIA